MRATSPPELFRLYSESTTIAVVGCSGNESKPAHVVPSYLQSQGYRIIPVNPREETVLGERSYESLRDVDMPVDIVHVFRPGAEAPDIAKDAVAVGARCFWLQVGIESEDAARIAEEAGLTVVSGFCIARAHAYVGLGPGLGPPSL